MGLDHGWYCLGCCWALFAFMVVVGTMNLVWMALITVVLSVERTVSWGGRLARGVGVVACVAGVVVLGTAFLGV
jgi:predicted metal-binding membrane protein